MAVGMKYMELNQSYYLIPYTKHKVKIWKSIFLQVRQPEFPINNLYFRFLPFFVDLVSSSLRRLRW